MSAKLIKFGYGRGGRRKELPILNPLCCIQYAYFSVGYHLGNDGN